jgi:hypothetical protein
VYNKSLKPRHKQTKSLAIKGTTALCLARFFVFRLMQLECNFCNRWHTTQETIEKAGYMPDCAFPDLCKLPNSKGVMCVLKLIRGE